MRRLIFLCYLCFLLFKNKIEQDKAEEAESMVIISA
jgi:hypothetical protein